jgi:nanoRNase/pAp phosphatase (c-di-AMP/oligoRNAs hydrolase)
MTRTELVGSELDLVAEEIRAGDRFLLTTHENPDGDALGSLLATHRILEALGKDSVSSRSRRFSTSLRRTSATASRSFSTAATSTGCRSTS